MLTTLPPSCTVVMKSGSLNFLEPSGPLQACIGTAYLTRTHEEKIYVPNCFGTGKILGVSHMTRGCVLGKYKCTAFRHVMTSSKHVIDHTISC
jgi:hypothetical protein